jgi:hypothetical protein
VSAAHEAIDDIATMDRDQEARGLRSIVHFNPGCDDRLGASFGIRVERAEYLPVGADLRAVTDLPADWDDLVDGLIALCDTWRARRREHPAIAGVHAVLERLAQCVVTFSGDLTAQGHRPRSFMLDGWWAEGDEAVLVLRRMPPDHGGV